MNWFKKEKTEKKQTEIEQLLNQVYGELNGEPNGYYYHTNDSFSISKENYRFFSRSMGHTNLIYISNESEEFEKHILTKELTERIKEIVSDGLEKTFLKFKKEKDDFEKSRKDKFMKLTTEEKLWELHESISKK